MVQEGGSSCSGAAPNSAAVLPAGRHSDDRLRRGGTRRQLANEPCTASPGVCPQWRGAGDRLVALAARRLARSAPASRVVELPACAGGPAWGLAKRRRSIRRRSPPAGAPDPVRADGIGIFLAGPGLAAGKVGRRSVLPQNRLMDLQLGRRSARMVLPIVGAAPQANRSL